MQTQEELEKRSPPRAKTARQAAGSATMLRFRAQGQVAQGWSPGPALEAEKGSCACQGFLYPGPKQETSDKAEVTKA